MERTGEGANTPDVSLVAPSRVVEASRDRAAMAIETDVEKDEQVMSEERIPTSEKLAQTLEAAGAPHFLS